MTKFPENLCFMVNTCLNLPVNFLQQLYGAYSLLFNKNLNLCFFLHFILARNQQHRSQQRRSSSLSYAFNAGMSKSMIMFESENNVYLSSNNTTEMLATQNGNGNNSNGSTSNGKHSPKFKRSHLKTVDIDFGGGSVPSSPAKNLQGVNECFFLFLFELLGFFNVVVRGYCNSVFKFGSVKLLNCETVFLFSLLTNKLNIYLVVFFDIF